MFAMVAKNLFGMEVTKTGTNVPTFFGTKAPRMLSG